MEKYPGSSKKTRKNGTKQSQPSLYHQSVQPNKMQQYAVQYQPAKPRAPKKPYQPPPSPTAKHTPKINQPEWNQQWEEAVKLHQKGAEGDKEAVIQANQQLETLCSQSESNLANAYYGSTFALMARDVPNPMEKFQKALKGLKLLDASVKQEPDNIEIRILRGNVSYRLPENYFHRTASAIEDFSYLVSRYEKDSSVCSKDFYCQLLFKLGEAYKRLDRKSDAEEVWKKLLTFTNDDKYRKLVAQQGFKLSTKKSSHEESSAAAQLTKTEPVEVAPTEGLKLYQHALATGKREAAIAAYDYFTKASEANPDNPLLKAYQADSMSLTGREAYSSVEMFQKGIDAMKTFDTLVNNNPNHVQIRFMRGYQSFRLPEIFFRRSATAIEDFAYLIASYEQNHSLFSAETYWQLIYDLGVSYERLNMTEEAEAAWQKLLSCHPNKKFHDMLEVRQEHAKEIALHNFNYTDKKQILEKGKHLHDLAVAGNRKAAKLAYELWQKAHDMHPEEELFTGYYGSSMALMGKYATEPQEMFGNAFKGLKTITTAIETIDPDKPNPHLHLLRGYVYYSLPDSFFRLTEKAIKDLRIALEAYEQDTSIFSKDVYHKLLFDLGKSYERGHQPQKAESLWNKLKSLRDRG